MKHILTIIILIAFLIGVMFVIGRVDKAEGAEDIDWDRLVSVIIQVESGGNPNAVSKAGCIGLMQISAIVLEEYMNWVKTQPKPPAVPYLVVDKKRLFHPKVNRSIGTWYLRGLKDHYLKIDDKDYYTIERMLAAYNGGITRLRKLNYDISKMPKETQNYIKKVMRLYKR